MPRMKGKTMATYDEISALANDPVFLRRLTVALTHAALQRVDDDEPAVVARGRTVLDNPAGYATRFALPVAANDAVNAKYVDGSVESVDDEAISAGVEAVWDSMG